MAEAIAETEEERRWKEKGATVVLHLVDESQTVNGYVICKFG